MTSAKEGLSRNCNLHRRIFHIQLLVKDKSLNLSRGRLDVGQAGVWAYLHLRDAKSVFFIRKE